MDDAIRPFIQDLYLQSTYALIFERRRSNPRRTVKPSNPDACSIAFALKTWTAAAMDAMA